MRLGTLIGASDWADPRFNRTLRELRLPLGQFLRKSWEYTRIVHALEDAGALDAGKRGLGLGTGAEVLCFHFANRAASVIATDMFSKESVWENVHLDLGDAYERSPFPYARERLQFKNMDMTKIDLPDASVDFVWSTSSVEHVSSVDAYLEVFRGIDRVLAPGGVAAIVTEFNLRPMADYRPHLILVDPPLIRRVEEVTQLRLTGGLDLSVEDHPCHVPMDLDLMDMVPYWQHLPNIWVQTQGALFTSALLIYRKDATLPRISGEERVDQAVVDKYAGLADALKRRQILEIRPRAQFTQCGELREVDGAPALVSNGQPGFLTFGPYLTLPAGRYRAQLRLRGRGVEGRSLLRPLAGALQCEADVALNSVDPTSQQVELKIAARSAVKLSPSGGDALPELTFETDARSRCELRVQVPGVRGILYLGALLQPL